MQAWTILYNPMAASGKSAKKWAQLGPLLQAEGIPFYEVASQYSGHSEILVMEAIERGARQILVVGGDGSVNEVANGIMRQEFCPSTDVLLSQFPCGTGNDWSRSLGIPKNIKKLIHLLKNPSIRIQDVGLVKWQEAGIQKDRYFVNIAGMGFDAYVGQIANAQKAAGKQGFMGYISALIKGLNQYECQPCSWVVDGKAYSKKELYSLNIGICKYSGAGMLPCPNALYDDGLLDLTIIEKLPKWKIIWNIPALFTGRFTKNKEVSLYTAKEIEIHCGPDNLLEVDGENIGSGTASFSLIPKALSVASYSTLKV